MVWWDANGQHQRALIHSAAVHSAARQAQQDAEEPIKHKLAD
jgi:hypothetical protein